jgi:hypothetical protein
MEADLQRAHLPLQAYKISYEAYGSVRRSHNLPAEIFHPPLLMSPSARPHNKAQLYAETLAATIAQASWLQPHFRPLCDTYSTTTLQYAYVQRQHRRLHLRTDDKWIEETPTIKLHLLERASRDNGGCQRFRSFVPPLIAGLFTSLLPIEVAHSSLRLSLAFPDST